MTGTGNRLAHRRMPMAAWAWEGLRRNQAYREAWRRVRGDLPPVSALPSGATILRETEHHAAALDFGLLHFADPEQDALAAPVFWRPGLFGGTLRVRLTSLAASGDGLRGDDEDHIILSSLGVRRVLLDTASGERHVLMNSTDFWLQLRCAPPVPPDDRAFVGIELRRAHNAEKRLATAATLLRLHHHRGPIAPSRREDMAASKLGSALIAYDVTRAGGSLRMIAETLFGAEIVADDWTGTSRYLKDRARRARAKGEAFVGGGYRRLLARCGR